MFRLAIFHGYDAVDYHKGTLGTPWPRCARWALLCLLLAGVARGDEPAELLSEPLAEAFGSAPLVRGLRLSPDGSRISFLQMHPDGYPLVNVFDTRSGNVTTVMAGERDGYDIRWCGWATERRLLCSLLYIQPFRNTMSTRTRLAAVNADGSEALLLLQEDRVLRTAQYQDNIVDWLPNDPEHVLLGLRISPSATINQPTNRRSARLTGARVVRLNIYDGKVLHAGNAQDGAVDWITDGHGATRLHVTVSGTHRTWYVREREEGPWVTLQRTPLTDLEDRFGPIAFERQANEVLFYDSHDGRRALFALELDNDWARRLVYAHSSVDVAGVHRIGRHNRIVAAVAIEDRPMLHFLEPRTERVHDMLAAEFPGMTVNVIDEDWAERHYLVFVYSDRDPGTYYTFDSELQELRRFARAFPALGELELASMQSISYPAADGTEIPAYLTLPPNGSSGAGVVLPHGGPSSRDYWRFDFLVQYLAAHGYVVLQSNYRGSAGYGEEWSGEGGFQNWRQAVDDIADGARYLVEAGIVDSNRLCIVGWSYGGYAALLSAIEHEPLYQCAVSIAGVTDPALLARNAGNFVGSRGVQAFIGSGEEVRNQGSPLRRAVEIGLPTLLLHGHKDVNVPLEQSLRLHDAMRNERADVELVEYAHAEHSISPPRYRIDMLTRLGRFLDTHLRAPTPDFYSRAAAVTDAVEILDFGTDTTRPNGICSDTRFIAASGRFLRDPTRQVRGTHDDATDCRRLFTNGAIVLLDSVGPDHSGSVPLAHRVTVFVDPAQQTEVEIMTLDGESLGRRGGVPVVYARPGYRSIAVRATERDYACTVGIAGAVAGSDAAERPYVVRHAGRDARSSLVRIPAYAGRYYRIQADVVDDVLLVLVTEATEDRVIVDQRELVGGCN